VYKFIFDEIYKRLADAEDLQVNALSWGKPESFEQYAEMVGRIAGIRSCIMDMHEVQEALDKQEEDDN
jgi:hypothetical protein